MRFPLLSVRGLAVFIAAMALTCVAAASASAAPLLWVTNWKTATVSTFEMGTGKAVGTPIAVGEQPISIAITPDGGDAFVANFGGNDVTVIDIATRTPVTTVPLPAHAEQIAISPDGKSAYVTMEGSKEVKVIDTESDQIVGSVTLAGVASAVAFTPDGKFAYASSGIEDIEVIETQTRKVVGSPIQVSEFPEAIAFTPDGTKAYVAESNEEAVAVVSTAIGQVVGSIPIVGEPSDLAITPSGLRLYVSSDEGTVTAVETQSNLIAGTPIPVSPEPQEIAITPNGKAAYVADYSADEVTPINAATNQALTPISMTGKGPQGIVVAPDQSPTAAFTAPSPVATVATVFSGAASTDPDGSVVEWNWAFGDGLPGAGKSAIHTYRVSGTYNAGLSVVDNEGCGSEQVFTGRTAYCSGGPATVTHPVSVTAAPIVCSANTKSLRIGRLIHNRKNGTAKLQVKLPATGSILLFGKKVHAVTRKVKKAGSMFLTIHARVELNKRLKKIHHTSVPIRVTFTPTVGNGPCAYSSSKTVHRSVSLLRAPRKKHHHS